MHPERVRVLYRYHPSYSKMKTMTICGFNLDWGTTTCMTYCPYQTKLVSCVQLIS